MGNRGVLHDEEGRIQRAWQGKRWLVCVLEFRGRKRKVMTPSHYTELFFLDEATALAAGHRPCAECRRERFNAFRYAWRLEEIWIRPQPPRSTTACIQRGWPQKKEEGLPGEPGRFAERSLRQNGRLGRERLSGLERQVAVVDGRRVLGTKETPARRQGRSPDAEINRGGDSCWLRPRNSSVRSGGKITKS